MKNPVKTGTRTALITTLLVIILSVLIIQVAVAATTTSDNEDLQGRQLSYKILQRDADPYEYLQQSIAQIQVTNCTVEPAVLMPNDIATVTLDLVNADPNTPVALNSARVQSKELKVLTPAYENLGIIGANNHLSLTFTLEAGINPGIYYPELLLAFRGSHLVRYPFPVEVQTTPVELTVYGTPDTYVEGKRAQVTLNLANLRTATVTGVMVTPDPGPYKIVPSSSFVGELSPYKPVQIHFNITPYQSGTVNFTAYYQNGINDHQTTCSLPVTIGESKKQANLSISRLEVTPGTNHILVKGDVYNSGLENANAIVITVKDPTKAVNPYKKFSVGLLKPSDFASFQVTFNPAPGAGSETLVMSFKDADGKEIADDLLVDISGALALMNQPSASEGEQTGWFGGLIPAGMEIPVIGVIIVILIAILIVLMRKQKPVHTHTYQGKAGIASETGESNSVSPDGNGEEAFAKAMDLYRAGEYMQAAELFYQVIQADKSHHKAWNAYGICFTRLEEFDSAANCFDNAIRLDPGNETYLKNRDMNEKKRKRAGV